MIANTSAGRSNSNTTTGQPTLAGSSLSAGDHFEKIYAVKLDYTGSSGYASIIHSYRESDQNQTGFFAGWNASDALLLYTEGNVKYKDKGGYQIGASYTLEIGPTVNVEYLHDNNGCDKHAIIDCYLSGQVDSRSVLYRKEYAMIQITDMPISLGGKISWCNSATNDRATGFLVSSSARIIYRSRRFL